MVDLMAGTTYGFILCRKLTQKRQPQHDNVKMGQQAIACVNNSNKQNSNKSKHCC